KRTARAVVRTGGRDRLHPRGPAFGHERIERPLREDPTEAGQVDRVAAGPPEQAVRAGPEAHSTPSFSSSSTGSKNEHVPIDWKSEARTAARRAGSAAR